MRFSIGFFAVIGAKLRADSSSDSCKYHDISNVNTFRRFPAVFNGTISVSGLEDSLRRGAWSLDIFRPCAVVADEVCDSHLPERRFENSPPLSPGGRFENSPPFQGWDCVANTQSPEGTVELFSGDLLS